MKLLKKIYKAVIDSLFFLIIGVVVLLWGIYDNGWGRIIIGGFLICWSIELSIQSYQMDQELEKWLKQNDGKFIFFFATKKKIQEKIKIEILPMFEEDVLQGYYEGPKIVGDLKQINYLLGRVMFFYPKIKPHHPSIIKIEQGDLIVKDELKVLMEINELDLDKQKLRKRIKKACV